MAQPNEGKKIIKPKEPNDTTSSRKPVKMSGGDPGFISKRILKYVNKKDSVK